MKTSIIVGATGLVGSNLHEILSSNTKHSRVYLVSRNIPNNLTEKSTHISFENGDYSIPAGVDYAYCCLGTTIKKAGSKEAFLKVDLELVVDFAKKAKQAGVKRFAVISSIGANAKSKNFYLNTKGKVEEQLKEIGFERLVIVQPSLLLGKRNEKRFGEDMGRVLYSVFKFLFIGSLKKYRGIEALDVAKAMVVLAEQEMGTITVESNIIQNLSGKYKNI